MAKISVVIPTMKGREEMLAKLISTIPPEYEIIIVDDEDLLLAAKRNKGAAKANNEYLLFIDDDNYLRKHAIENMVAGFDTKIGVMGMVACYHSISRYIADGGSKRNYLTGFTTGVNTNERINDIDQEVYDVDEVANAFMIRREVFNLIGGFDEENFPIDLDEADLCKRIKDMGYRIVYNPKAICYHDSITYSHIPDFRRPLNAYFMGKNRQIYQRKHNTTGRYILYLVLFMPVFVVFYCVSLLYRRKPQMIFWFLKGVFDGISGSKKNPFQQR